MKLRAVGRRAGAMLAVLVLSSIGASLCAGQALDRDPAPLQPQKRDVGAAQHAEVEHRGVRIEPLNARQELT